MSNNDAKEIADLHRLFALQKAAFNSDPYPDYETRLADLNNLKQMLRRYREDFIQAMSDDFGYRSRGDAAIGDIMTTLHSINYCMKRLKGWMKPAKRKVEIIYQPAKNYVMYQPLGVVGLLGCWNYPLFESFAHLAFILSAGNRCIIKGSEFVPHTNSISRSAITEFFNESQLGFIEGEVETAQALTALPFDHILVTGSSQIGKQVMKAAAENLTPVTLELGGKSPLIIDTEIKIETAVARFILGKTLNAGQTCVAPDYVFCPADKIEALKTEIQRKYNMMYPDLMVNEDWTSIVNDRQYKRLCDYLQDARQKGAKITPLAHIEPRHQDEQRKIPLHLLTEVSDEMIVMQEEIFGPLLPILPYHDVEQVVTYIQSKPRPLALYICSNNREFQDRILKHTHAGGVSINQTALHVAQYDLPFGGIGNSGMGKIHATEGFRTFSNQKAVFHKGKIDFSTLLSPPFHSTIKKLLAKYLIR